MVDATRVFEPGFQITNAAGTPQSGAVLRFYAAGTANTRTVYSDSGLSTSLGVTVTTNAAGRPAASAGAGAEVVIYTGTTAYKVTAETSAGASLWSFDNVIGALDTSSFLTSSVTLTTPVISKTADYSIVTGDKNKVINANSTGGTFTLTLPSAVTVGDGWRVTIRMTGTANQVNVATVAAQTINAQSSLALTVYLEAVTLVSDGANWHASETANEGVAARQHLAAGLGFSLIGGNVIASVASNALTFAIKNSAGNDPTTYAPVKVLVRGQSEADEEFAVATITAATSVTITNGSTLGTSNGTAFRLWVVGINDAGTFRLGVVNCLSGTNIYPLGQFPVLSSTAEGGAGAADSAHVVYTGAAVSSKPYHILGYASWESGLGTAGAWSSAPTRFQLYGYGVPLPGQTIQVAGNDSTALASGIVLIPFDNTTPSSTEGDQYMSQAITPTSAANILAVNSRGHFANSAAQNGMTMALLQDSTVDALKTTGHHILGSNGAMVPLSIEHRMLAATTSATTFKIRGGGDVAGTTAFNGTTGANARYNGTINSFLRVTEIMA